MAADKQRPQVPRPAGRDGCDREPCPWSASIFHVLTTHRPRETAAAAMTAPVLNLADVPLEPHAPGGRFAAAFGRLSAALGAERLGYRLTVVPPGASAWPYHRHHGNEEMVVVLAGCGTLRLDGGRSPLREGDVVALPAGTAHEVVNDSDAELRYLAVSTMNAPDVVEYPDSGKVGVFAGAAPGGDRARRTVHMTVRAADAVDYWEGER